MMQINLLPWREEERKFQKSRFLVLVIFASLCVISIFSGLHIYYGTATSKQQDLNDYLQSEINAAQSVLAAINDKQKSKVDLEDQLHVILNIYKGNYAAVSLLNELVKIMPRAIDVQSISRAGNLISIQGAAKSDSDVTLFMQDIAQSPIFFQPVLSNINGGGSSTENGMRYFKIDVEQRG